MSKRLINRLLSGIPLSGEEAGKIIIYANAKELELQQAGKDTSGVLPQIEMQACINSLDSFSTSTFNKYVSLNNTIRYAYNICIARKEIAKSRLITIETSIADVAGYANRVRLFNRLPAMFTVPQINDMWKQAEQEFSTWQYGLIDVICSFIGHQINLFNEGKADVRFSKIMTDYKARVITKPLRVIVNLIWYDYEQYFIKDAPLPLRTKEDLHKALRYRNIQPLKECTKKEAQEPLTYDYIQKVMPASELDLIKKDISKNAGDKIHTFYDFFNNITFEDVNTLKKNDISLKGILEEHFVELYEYARTEVLNLKGLEVFKTDADALVTLPELAQKRVLDFDLFYNEMIADKYGYKDRGVAVINSTWGVKPADIDEKGYYKCSMDAITYDDLARLIHSLYEHRIDSTPLYEENLKWPIAFNIIIDLLASAYKIKELKAYKISMDDINSIVDSINNRIKDVLLYKFMPIDMGAVTDAESKLDTIREEFMQVFPFISTNFFAPEKQDIDATASYVGNIKNFATLSPSLAPFYILYGVRR